MKEDSLLKLKAHVIGPCGIVLGFMIMLSSVVWGLVRYPVGQPVLASVYTEPFDPCDPNLLLAIEQYHALAEKIADEYIKHLKEDVKRAEQYIPRYDPNDPAYKFIAPAPKDWTDKFGDNERTRLLHSISELRVIVAAQGKRLMALEEFNKKYFDFSGWDPNRGPALSYPKDPNEAKR